MEDFIEMNESILGEHVDLSIGCSSHDTMERVVNLVNPDFIKELKLSFEASSEATDFFKLIAVDRKTICGNRGKSQSPTHIVTAYEGTNGQVAVDNKSNEITAIPRLLRQLDLCKSVVTIDAMGTQPNIVVTIVRGRGGYCLAIKGVFKKIFAFILVMPNYSLS